MGEYGYEVGPRCVFYREIGPNNCNRRVGRGALKTCLVFADASSGLSGLDKATAQKIQELEGLIRRQPIGHKRGPFEDEISKILTLLVYGDQQIPETQVRIENIRRAL